MTLDLSRDRSFAELERDLNVSLPEAYKNLLLNYPSQLLAHDGAGLQKRYSETHLLRTPKDLFYYNSVIRKKLSAWPKGWFIIGLDRGSSYYVLLLESENPSQVHDVNLGENYELEQNESISFEELDEARYEVDEKTVADFISTLFKNLEGEDLRT
jgi:hypothetical protein